MIFKTCTITFIDKIVRFRKIAINKPLLFTKAVIELRNEMSLMNKFETRIGCNSHFHELCKKRNSKVKCRYCNSTLAKARANCHQQEKIGNW